MEDLLDFGKQLDVGLLESTVSFMYMAGTNEQVGWLDLPTAPPSTATGQTLCFCYLRLPALCVLGGLLMRHAPATTNSLYMFCG